MWEGLRDKRINTADVSTSPERVPGLYSDLPGVAALYDTRPFPEWVSYTGPDKTGSRNGCDAAGLAPGCPTAG